MTAMMVILARVKPWSTPPIRVLIVLPNLRRLFPIIVVLLDNLDVPFRRGVFQCILRKI
jgi:hypothetical protein